MGLVNITPIEDGTSATANSINEPIGKLAGEINGNLDSANLKNGAVTTAKIADASVTSAKMSVDKYTDDNGWLVEDYGTTKNYSYTKTGTISIPHQTFTTLFYAPLPVGVTNVSEISMSLSHTMPLAEAISNFYPTVDNTIQVTVANPHYSYDLVNGTWTAQIMARDI